MGVATSRFQDILAKMWSANTIRGRASIWRRFLEWCRRERSVINADSAALFVVATGVSTQGQMAYAKSLSAIFLRFRVDRSALLTLMAALRANSGDIPIRQAIPFTKQGLLSWADQQSARVRLGLYIGWKTASRWDEIRQLRRRNFIRASPREVIIDWATLPKGRRGNPFHASRYSVIVGDLTPQISSGALTLTSNHADLSDISSAKLTRMMQASGLPQTSRSIKRGAVTHLTSLAARKGLDPAVIPNLSKHKVSNPVLPDMTIRYGADPASMARLLGTSKATRWL